jgi:imidazoleglycerol-phosphate dehydratase/histidinol-phosphatase
MTNQAKKKALFIDRDGTLVIEPPVDYQLDSLEKLQFYPGVFRWLSTIAETLDYELVMVTNQDGLGTDSFPEETFWPPQNKMMEALEGEGIAFTDVLIDRSFPADNAPTRKPRTGMFGAYLEGNYDLQNSFVLGDRLTDIELAKNLGSKGIWINNAPDLAVEELENGQAALADSIALTTSSWKAIYEFLKSQNSERRGIVQRTTKETDIFIDVNLDGTGSSEISTGISFFDHMLEQIARHGNVDLKIKVNGDLEVDEHHTIEDTAIALGEAFDKALGNKRGIERYGYCLPMDDCLAQVALDFGGRNWIEWDAEFKREMIGKMPTEMFFHFFKSFTDAARCNLNVKAEGVNEHHKIEAIFKALAKSIRMAVKRDVNSNQLPSTKGVL